MKKIFLIKKDITKNAQDNWIIMNSHDFYMFSKTEDGKLRTRNVVRMPDEEKTGPILYMEVDDDTAKEWRSEFNHMAYRNRISTESQISTVSYHGIKTEDEELSGEDLISDSDCDVEAEALSTICISSLKKAFASLSDSERTLIEYLYLSDSPMTEREYAALLGISHQRVNKKKIAVLKKLKKIMIF